MRMPVVAALFMALSSAFLLYGLSYDTRQLERVVHRKERLAEKTRNDIAVLRAERAHLARPERIEEFARAMGLKPATQKQLARDLAGTSIITGSNPNR